MLNKNTGGKITSYTYGKTGALATQTNENATITNKYNAQGLVKAVRSDYDNRYNEIYYGYTDDGKMTSYTAYNNGSTMNGSFKFSYTPEGYLKEIMNDTVIKATYTYDKDANLTSAIYNGTNITKNYSYYENGALKNVTNKNGNTVVSQYTCEYQLDGNLSRVTDNVGGQKTYAYDSTGKLASETYKKGTLTEITSYTYDSRGNCCDII